MDNGILAAGAQDIDFMIHGLFSYKISDMRYGLPLLMYVF